MEKRNMVIAVLAIITMGLAIPLAAQTSNQKTATAGVFSTDVDNYMSVKNFDKVNFERWFGFFGGDAGGNVKAGYATNLGSIYLGGFYTGRIIDTGTDETKTRTTTWDENLQQQLTQTDETEYYKGEEKKHGDDYRPYGWTNTDNNISAFIGVAGMGIKLGFYEKLKTANTPFNIARISWEPNPNTGEWEPKAKDTSTSQVTKNEDGSITYYGSKDSVNDSINYEESYGVMNPYLQWGMKINAGDYVLAPRISGSVNINRSYIIDEYYINGHTELDGKIVGEKEIWRKSDNRGYVGLDIGVGADFYLRDTTFIGIDYTIGLNFFGQDYSGAGKSGTIKGTLWSDAESKTIEYFDRTYKYNKLEVGATEREKISHRIIPSFWNTNVVRENLKVGTLVRVPITIGSETTNDYKDRYYTEETTYLDAILSSGNTNTVIEEHEAGLKVEKSTFDIAPTIGIGASYAMVPDKFTVNAGVNLKPIKYARTSTVISQNGSGTTTYSKTETGADNNKYTSEETKTVNAPTTIEDTVSYVSEWTGLNGSISAGFVFKFYDFFSLDLLAVSGEGFEIGLTDVNVLFSIKF